MNKLKYLYVALFSTLLTACFDDAPSIMEQIEAQPNTIGFVSRTVNASAVADGEEYEFTYPVQVVGPSSENLSGTYSAQVSVDPSSTAIEGVHYRLEQTEITASEEEGFLGQFTVVMLTEGIEPPLAENPVLILNVTEAEGPGNVIASGAQLRINLLYLCPSYLAGTYKVTIKRDNGAVYNYDDVITELAPGQFRGRSVGHWAPGSIGGTPGFTFFDVCGTISVPTQNLVDLYSNVVSQSGKATDSVVDPETGNFRIVYSVDPGGIYTAEYVKQQ